MTDRYRELEANASLPINRSRVSISLVDGKYPVDSTRLQQYDLEISRARDIFEDRNKIYKDAFVFLGMVGTVVTLIGDCFRLRNMILQSPDKGRSHKEQIEDKLYDVINQSVITLMMLRENNYEGK